MRNVIIIGLGNPGREYVKNRHNVGHIICDQIAQICGSSFSINKKCNSSISRLQGLDFLSLSEPKKDSKIGEKNTLKEILSGINIILAKPEVYMNNSGNAAISLLQEFKPIKTITLHDELDLEFGRIKSKLGGGDNGHNGLRSISSKIGPNYYRARFGIGRPPKQLDDKSKIHSTSEISVSSYVLSDFSAKELDTVAILTRDVMRVLCSLVEK